MKETLFNTHDLALIISIYQCLFFSLFLITIKKGKRSSNILLSLFFLAQAAIPLDNLINFGEGFRSESLAYSPNLFYIFGLAYWLEAPLLLLYIRSIIYKNFKLKKTDALYFIPFVLFAVYFYITWISLGDATKVDRLQGTIIAGASLLDREIHIFRECFRFFCGVLCLIELRHYKEQIKNEVAELETINLTWLNILTIGFLVVRGIAVCVAVLIFFSYELSFNVDHEFMGLMSNYLMMLFITILILFNTEQSTIFKGIDQLLPVKKEKDNEPIDPEILNKIEQYMTAQKPYLNHLLSQKNLANQLELVPRTLSIIINHHYKRNFFEFINQYRIEESKSLLTNVVHKNKTMLEVMDMAGFNSKATFNTFFKKLVGVTPTQYRKDFFAKNDL